jgi:hypothetical protein
MPKLQEFLAKNSNRVTAANAMNIFEELIKHENVAIDEEHAEDLRSIMETIIVPALAHTDGFSQTVQFNLAGTLNLGAFHSKDNSVLLEVAGNHASSPVEMSLQETAVHEYVHALFYFVLENDHWARTEVEKLYNVARENVQPVDLLNPSPDGQRTQSDMDKAQARWDYIFNNPKGMNLHEFAAIGLTNKALKTALLNTPIPEKKKIWSNNPIKLLGNILSRAVDLMVDSRVRLKGKNAGESLLKLFQDLATVNEAQRVTLFRQVEKRAAKAIAQGDVKFKAFVDNMFKKADKYYSDEAKKREKELEGLTPEEIKAKRSEESHLLSLPKNLGNIVVRLRSNKVRKQHNDILRKSVREFVGEDGFIYSVGKEITGMSQHAVSTYRKLFRWSHQLIDVARKKTADKYAEFVEKSFGRELNDDEWKATNDIVLRLDMQSMLDKAPVEKLADLLDNDILVSSEINSRLDIIKENAPSAWISVVNQAMGLGSYLSRGVFVDGNVLPQMNAHNIAKLQHLPVDERQDEEALKDLVGVIDELATLYAIQLADPVKKKRVHKIFMEELERGPNENGMVALLQLHRGFVEDSLERSFNNNPSHMMKGWTRENFDQHMSVVVDNNDEATRKKLAELGYFPAALVPRDPNDPSNTKSRMLYTAPYNMGSWLKGIYSLTSEQHKGTSFLDIARGDYEPGSNPHIEARENVQEYLNNIESKVLMQNQVLFNPTSFTEALMVPVYSKDGRIVDMRYMMSLKTKDTLLKREDLANTNIGMMLASVQDRINTKLVNAETTKVLFQDYTRNLAKPRKQQRVFVRVAPDAPQAAMREMWAMLPEDAKRQAEKVFGAQEIWVRKEMFRYIMGQRQWTLTGSVIKHVENRKSKFSFQIPRNAYPVIYMADLVIQEVATMAKSTILLLPNVVIGNVISNIALLLANGVPPSYIMQNLKVGISAMRQHIRVEKELAHLNAKAMSRTITKDEEARIQFLLRQQRANPVNVLIEKGVLTSIVAEVEPRDVALKKKPIAMLSKEALSFIPPGGQNAFKEVLMRPGTKLFNGVMGINIYSDFLGRFILFKHMTEVEKQPREAALNHVLDSFVYYDEPQHPYLQAANDYGLFMFSKFLLRTQRIYAKLLHDRPTATIGMALFQSLTNLGIPDIGDNFMSFSGLTGERLNVPFFGVVPDIFQFPAYQWANVLNPLTIGK